MQQQKSKKILIYFFLFLMIGTLNNKNLNNIDLTKVNEIVVTGLDEKDNIYLARINSFKDMEIRNDEDNFKNYIIKQKTNNKNSILKSYDLFLNNKYKVNLNQKTIERIKNNF